MYIHTHIYTDTHGSPFRLRMGSPEAKIRSNLFLSNRYIYMYVIYMYIYISNLYATRLKGTRGIPRFVLQIRAR